MSNNTSSIVGKVWTFCNPLRDVGVGYRDYLEQLELHNKIEETINQSLIQTETLMQSILKKACEGKLANNNN